VFCFPKSHINENGGNADVLCYCRWHSRQGDKFLIQRLGRTDAKERRGNEEVSLLVPVLFTMPPYHDTVADQHSRSRLKIPWFIFTSFLSKTGQRLFLEAWYSNQEEKSINEHVEFLVRTSISRNSRPYFGARVMGICHLLAFLPSLR